MRSVAKRRVIVFIGFMIISKKERRAVETVLLEYLFTSAKTEESLPKMLNVLHSCNRDERWTNASLSLSETSNIH